MEDASPGRSEEEALAPLTPIEDYSAIGDCHGAALISREGSVDWCVLGRFDADPVFCRILDERSGGFFSVRPRGSFTATRRYLPDTNVLETVFHADGGRVRMTDFMPVGRDPSSGVHDYVSLRAPHWVVRRVEGLSGRVAMEVGWRPAVDFLRRTARLRPVRGAIVSAEGPCLYADADLACEGDTARGRLEIAQGEDRFLTATARATAEPPTADALRRLLAITRAFWEEWSRYCRYEGPYRQEVVRSALVLKLLTYSTTGAIVAAPTTSLPERIGGSRNWDYRFCWLRDASFTLYALSALGYGGEARDFAGFLRHVCTCKDCTCNHGNLQIMYGITGETELVESDLGHLEGYGGSRPVRVGNDAFRQRQLDVHGELMDFAYLYETLGGRLDAKMRELLEAVVDHVVREWDVPGQGIWEMRGPPRHHTYGKMMCWVALDRAARLLGDREEWVGLRDRIRKTVREAGVHPDGYFRIAFGEEGTDAALLLTPFLGFPVGDEEFAGTVREVDRSLRRGDFIRRYTLDDGLEEEEGAFLACSFWYANALLLLGREEEAKDLFGRLLGHANDVGLFSEEADPDTRSFLGNFPQGLTHLAVIQSANYLELYRRGGREALRGSHARRSRIHVGRTVGLRAVRSAMEKTMRVGRLWSSGASVLPLDLLSAETAGREAAT